MAKNQKKPFCYILFSQKLNRYYTGSTLQKPEARLKMHLEKQYGNMKFTSKADDWVIFLQIDCKTIDEARYFESHIKQMKSSQYIRNLKMYPEIILKLRERFLNRNN